MESEAEPTAGRFQIPGRPVQCSSCFQKAPGSVSVDGWVSSPRDGVILQLQLPSLPTAVSCWNNNLFMIWNRSQTSPHCLSSEQSQTPIPARAGLGALSIFLPWHLRLAGALSVLGAALAFHLRPSVSVAEARGAEGGGASGRAQGVSAFPGPYTGKFPSHLPGPDSIFSMWALLSLPRQQ